MIKDILKDEKVELKSCPFCGSEADFGEKIYKRSRSIIIGCINNKCFCRFSLKLSNQTKPENFIRIFKQLIEKWNKREDEEVSDDNN